MVRLRTASAGVVANNYISSITTRLREINGVDLSSSPLLRRFRRALRRLTLSDIPAKQAAPLPPAQARKLIVSAPSPLGAVILLAVLFAARVGDVLKLRAGDVFLENDADIQISPPSSKTFPFGLPRKLLSLLPSCLRAVLSPYVATCPPQPTRCVSNRPLDRPEMFPNVTTDVVRSYIKEIFPQLSAHSIRRGALQALAEAGVPPEDLLLLSLHRSLTGLSKYMGDIPPMQRQKFSQMGATMSRLLSPT